MITVNMGGLSETLFESELFGHVKGAFTDAKTDRAGRFELAGESTLFMDEIANIPLAQQAKLLRVIETGDFERVGSSKTLHANVRIISATNANVENEVAAGRFRQDLLFRLNTIQIALPPLRDRRVDPRLMLRTGFFFISSPPLESHHYGIPTRYRAFSCVLEAFWQAITRQDWHETVS
jgi:transcriptional regulator with GAF, ATPase, and Fis domain